MDVEKQISHWRDSAADDLQIAKELIVKGWRLQGLFWAHLAIEKMLKAHVCKRTSQPPPKIHNLILLAEKAELELDEERRALLHELNAFQAAGRYHDALREHIPDRQQTRGIVTQAEEVLEWLKKLL